ncbi:MULTISPECIES: isochorismatase family cysteine hydrolase [Methylobacterium]|uniref:Peroxyureidoacrylate/ureidoacrylate amidohydrolase RutB n=3 Tax=Pseudomonadota TaxID=1224 RepID=A0ABQ4SVN4_9HYPH|nr:MULTISPECIES: isochorismatase family cysteine hydrolase [Methylobacterium]GBU18317.1 isochorismatase [Methylobacterium sp.]GJE05960.1 Peroxyureidoacrylate/ureidoacrylate amidohydrolase RutB [Methylobacterium jeotgali]
MTRIHGLPVLRTLEDVCASGTLAFLIYDMQAGICSQIKGADAVTKVVVDLRGACREAGVPVVYTRHLSLPKPWTGSFATRMGMAWQRTDDPEAVKPWFLRDSPAFALVPELAPDADEIVFDKLAMSAFEGTPLTFALRDRGIAALAIAGIATEIGIEPTVRHAADLGIVPIVVTDACAGGHAEAAERSLESLRFMGDAILTDSATFRAAFATSSGAPR